MDAIKIRFSLEVETGSWLNMELNGWEEFFDTTTNAELFEYKKLFVNAR